MLILSTPLLERGLAIAIQMTSMAINLFFFANHGLWSLKLKTDIKPYILGKSFENKR
jgi:hypothetical protein